MFCKKSHFTPKPKGIMLCCLILVTLHLCVHHSNNTYTIAYDCTFGMSCYCCLCCLNPSTSSALLFHVSVLIKAVLLLLFLAFNACLKIIFMSLSPTVSGEDIVFRSWIHLLSPLTPVSRDALSRRLVEQF